MSLKLMLVAVAASMVFVVGCGPTDAPVAPSTSAGSGDATAGQVVQPEVKRESFGEFAFTIPEGWMIAQTDPGKTKAMLVYGGTSMQDAKGMVMVDVGSPIAPTPQGTAEGFAKNMRGQVLPDAIEFDGESAVRVTTPSTDLNLPRDVNVVYHNGKAYLLMAAAVEGVDVTSIMEQIRSTWKWSK